MNIRSCLTVAIRQGPGTNISDLQHIKMLLGLLRDGDNNSTASEVKYCIANDRIIIGGVIDFWPHDFCTH